ncbi:MAG: TonB-dependent receptor [Gemmatimonadetes bacterium]|nr:TonB-dependent receptor [Gemmatimonadota bacterium]MYC00169.1 TonB-dependent receptor [Gemmatimonadota bacterium]MYI46248.1 TonB-dependent receptor [Gemmatimonadota bacterium]
MALLLVPASLAAQEPAIRGIVINAETGEPLPGAAVLIRSTPLRTSTAEDGSFRITLLAPGTHVLIVAADGFRNVERTIQPMAAEDPPIRIELERLFFEIPNLTVTANRGTNPGDAPTSVAVVSADELVRRNVTHLGEALPFAQGVTFNAGEMDIRGSGGISRGVGSRVLMLLDGHRTLGGVTSAIDFGVMPILDVERIEIVKGPHSTLWGSNALGGVVNVITRPPLGGTRTVVRGYYGLFDTPGHLDFSDERLSMRGIQIQHSQKVGGTHTTVFLGREGSDGFRQNGAMDRWRVRAKAIFRAESAAPWELFASWKLQDLEEFFTWVSPERPLEVDPDYLNDWKRDSDLIVGLTARPLVTSKARLELRPQVQHVRSQNYFHDSDDFHRSTRYGTDLQLSLYSGGRHTVTLGGEAAYTGVSSNFLEPNPGVTDLALFAQDEIDFSERVHGSIGFRFDTHRASFVENDLAFNPKIGVVYHPSDRLSLRTSLSRGYRAPSVSEQFTSTTVFGFKVVPNLELRGESAWSAEVGGTATPGDRLWLDAGLFWSEYSGLIEVAAAPGAVELFTFQFRNVSEARIRGLDTGVRVGVIPSKLNLHTNYLFLDSRDLASGRELAYRSRHNLTTTLSAWDDAVGLDMRYRTRPEVVLAYPLDERGDVTLVDLRLNFEVMDVDVQTKVANLLQAEYVDIQERNPGASRSFRVTVTSRF